MKEDRDRKRPESKRPKMPRIQRAKQFAPFESLTGLGDILKQAEEDHRRAKENAGVIHVELEEEQGDAI